MYPRYAEAPAAGRLALAAAVSGAIGVDRAAGTVPGARASVIRYRNPVFLVMFCDFWQLQQSGICYGLARSSCPEIAAGPGCACITAVSSRGVIERTRSLQVRGRRCRG